MKKIHYIIALLFLAVVTPLHTLLAATNDFAKDGGVGSIKDVVLRLLDLVNPLIAFGTGFAIFGFVKGVAGFIYYADNEEKRAEGKKGMAWALIGLFVLFSFWGMVFLIQGTYFGPGNVSSPFNPFGN